MVLLPGDQCVIHRLLAVTPRILTRGDNASCDDPPAVTILARVTAIRRTAPSRALRVVWACLFACRRWWSLRKRWVAVRKSR
ncbi:hypothetical protein, partial [Acinetobacter sp. LH3_13]|uniref:hypothetical protein n=1 Tax=Acinetobacter sp. LH3_13 TaxID=3434463 RepID=UPI003EBDE941